LLVGGALALRFGLDPLLQRAYDRGRPRIEQLVGHVMGHPLELGAYRGIGPEGLRVGPSRFRSGPEDGSTISTGEIQVRFHPLASWRQRGLVLDLDVLDPVVDLRRNAQGQLWVLGRLKPGGEPPRVDLRIRVPRASQLRIWNVTAQGKPLAFQFKGGAQLRLHERSIRFRASASAPGEAGEARVVGDGNWQRNLWRVDLATRRFAAAPFEPLLPVQGTLRGQAEGQVNFQLDRGRPSCKGTLTVRQASWQPPALEVPLTSDRLAWSCQDRTLTLADSPWRYGTWGGRIAGRTATDGRLVLDLIARPPAANPLAALPLKGRLSGHWIRGGVAVERLEGSLGRSTLLAEGRLTRDLALRGDWRLEPTELPQSRGLPAWLRQRPVEGRFSADGPLRSPRLVATTRQSDLPLIGSAAVSLQWSQGLLQLIELRSDHLLASASLPLSIQRGRGLAWGDLSARIQLRDYPLSRLNRTVGATLAGRLDVDGSLRGPLRRLLPDLNVRLRNPGGGPLRLDEIWSGTLVGQGDGARLRLIAEDPAPAGRLEARFDQRWHPLALGLQRRGGSLALNAINDPGRDAGGRYRWQARSFPLQGLAVALGARSRLRSLQGELSGQGDLALRPLSVHGDLVVDHPGFLRLAGRSLRASVAYADRRYRLRGKFEALVGGSVAAQLEGRPDGPFQARVQVRAISAPFIRELLAAYDLWRGRPLPPRGRAADLGTLAIDTLGRSIEEQLELLAEAGRLAEQRDLALAQASRAEKLERLQLALDADLLLSGPDLRHARAELQGRGNLWIDANDRDRSLAREPFRFQLAGPLRSGEGSFELEHLPLSLLALLTPVPANLRGTLQARGRYGLGGGEPSFSVDLALQGAGLGAQDLALQRGRVDLRGQALNLDLSLRAAGASNSVDLAGTVPLDPSSTGLEVRIASRDDGLLFLTRLAGGAGTIDWKRGSADLQLLVRGSLADPIANGFLRLRNGECRFIGQSLQGLQATVLFDSQQLVLQDLVARVGRGGRIHGQGKLGLVRPLDSDTGLAFDLTAIPFAVSRITAQAQGRLTLAGSLLAPRLGGDVAIGHGSINVQPAAVAKAEPASHQPAQPTSVSQLVEGKWDFRKPLVLLGPDVASTTSASLEEAIPRVPWLSFDGLRIALGPDLRVVVPNVANFQTGGSLRISGRLDPSLRASGVVKLLGGRLNLFTTSFSLDPDAPNVAIFTPSLGLVPYLDIALRTRIADSLNVIAPSGLSDAASSSLALTQQQAQGGFSSFNQLNLILVTVSVSGPADRIAENLKLRSSPPLPQDRLVALIGGNSLAGLSGGGAGTALATVLGQSLLSPLLSSLSDAFGQRVSLALYPTYVTPAIESTQERRSGRVPPQLVLGSEIGYDLTDRINTSVLAAPNRSDIPPQVTVNYKASEQVNVEASVDTQGSWQTQLRVFFRF
jgi:translocation and assembly module TamB